MPSSNTSAPKRKGRKPLLNREEIDDIRYFYFKSSWRVPQLAVTFKVSKGTIHQVLNRQGAYKD